MMAAFDLASFSLTSLTTATFSALAFAMNSKLSGLTMLGRSTQCGTTQRDNSRPDSFTSFGELSLAHYLK
ncbi:MAG: hypothetical protein EBS27_03770 [Actinobacteria bacterium]|nr:hypothetical protein [Actinomycetota bacterium]